MNLRSLSCIVLLLLGVPITADAQRGPQPTTVIIKSGSLKLRAQVWTPSGSGPLPAVLFSPGSGQEPKPNSLARLFAKHGYVFMALYRRGQGLSTDQGNEAASLMRRERETNGEESANRLQMRLLEGEELQQQRDALSVLRALPQVDPSRVAIVGFSFGGSLAMLHAEEDPTIRAVINFGGAAGSWNRSPQLRERLISAARKMNIPVLFVFAENDYTTLPAEVLSTEMARGKQNLQVQLKIYPAFGTTVQEGHRIIYLSMPTWERDVFAFLKTHTGPRK